MNLKQMQEKGRELWNCNHKSCNEIHGMEAKDLDEHTAATWKAALDSILESGLLEEKDYVYEDENKEHNEFESTLEHHETMGEAHHSGHNTLARAIKELISNMNGEVTKPLYGKIKL